MKENKLLLQEVVSNINAKLFKGDMNFYISSIESSQNNFENTILYLRDKKYLKNIDKSKSKTCLVSIELIDFASNFDNIIVSENPSLSFALLTKLFKKNEVDLSLNKDFSNTLSIGSGSQISENVKFGKNVSIGCNCVIEDGVLIGDNSIIENNVVIYRNSKIGNNTFISSGVIIGSEGFGFAKQGSKWVQISHLGKVVIGNDVSIGANSCIDRGTIEDTVISDNVIIDNSVHIAHNVFIGERTAIAAKVGIAGSSIIGADCQIGGMTGIFGHLKITDNVILSPKSNVYRDVKKPGTYSSIFPLIDHFNWKKISILISKLDKIKFF